VPVPVPVVVASGTTKGTTMDSGNRLLIQAGSLAMTNVLTMSTLLLPFKNSISIEDDIFVSLWIFYRRF
jgi:hypothetical protein